jgi:hypothetical protein
LDEEAANPLQSIKFRATANSTAANMAVTHAAVTINTHGIRSIAPTHSVPFGVTWERSVTTVMIE